MKAEIPERMVVEVERIVRDLFIAIEAQRVMVRVQERPGGQCPAIVQVTAGAIEPAPDDPNVDFSQAPTFLAVKSGEVLVQRDVIKAEQPATPPHLVEYYGIRAQMLHPLSVAGTFVGLLAVHEIDGVRDWSEEDRAALSQAATEVEEVLEKFAPQTSMLGEAGVEGARLTRSLSLHEAEGIRDRAIEHAMQIGATVTVAVVDSGARPIVLSRMDDAPFMMAELAIGKAECAVGMGMPSGDLQEAARPTGDLYGVNTLLGGRVLLMGGGIPLMDGDRILGAIGVSGGTTAQDKQIAEAAKSVWEDGRG